MLELELDREEEAVYDGIKQYLLKNRFFKIKDIIPFLRNNIDKSLELSGIKIELILLSLIKKKIIAPRSKLTKEDILKNQKRNETFKFIESNPGTYLYDVMKSIKLGSHEALWHLNMLKKFQFIRTLEIDNREALYKHNLDSSYDNIFYYLRNEKVKKIIDVMENKEDALNPTKISDLTEMHYNTTKKYLEILTNLNFIKNLGSENKRVYTLDRETYIDTLKNLDEISSKKKVKSDKPQLKLKLDPI